MEYLIPLFFFLVILLVVITLAGHGIWLLLAWIARQFKGGSSDSKVQTHQPASRAPEACLNCSRPFLKAARLCGACGAVRPTTAQAEILRDLGATLRQLERLYRSGALADVEFRHLRAKIEREREQLIFPNGRRFDARQPSLFTPRPVPRDGAQAQRPMPQDAPARESAEVDSPGTATPPFVTSATFEDQKSEHAQPDFGAWTADSNKALPATPVPKPSRRPFAEVLARFMEESNIRWGEIVGGVLIVGCSTALVISLWAEISRIPVLKFLIFTTVTAALFSVGFYTEHRWKLPTTSRGILTIASLLVPLNFLAIAAVSGSTAPPGALIIISEFFAPALFLCLVYFAGRVITPGWPQLLATGVLGSSVGQLLIRHFAGPDNSPGLLVALGAFPVVCYVGVTAWMLRRALADSEIDEEETNSIFITLGAITFASVLPFGLLLFRSGPMAMSMMHLAPLVTLGGTPMLATGTLLWRRVNRKELLAARTAGTSIAILGLVVVLSGMFLSWPNPASIVPAALLNFAVFTALAVLLELPVAHVFGAGCLTLAYIVIFHVVAGHVPWQNLRVASLLRITGGADTGKALAIPFVVFTLTHDWLTRKQRGRDAFSYVLAACGVAVISIGFATVYGIRIPGDPHYVSAILALYAAGAFWFAWRQKSVAFTWTAALLLFFATAQTSGSLLALRLPWQATMLIFAAICLVGALIIRQYGNALTERVFLSPLQKCAIASSILATLFLLIAIISGGFEPASLLAVRAFWLAAIWAGLLVLSRVSIFFTAFEMTLVLGAVLSTKSFLQRFDWYAYQPNTWLHPWALQIQGCVLGLICIAWVAIRAFAQTRLRVKNPTNETGEKSEAGWIQAVREGLAMPIAFDHLLTAMLVISFALLVVFGALSGINKELTLASRIPPVFDLAGFRHELIFGAGGWILLAILLAAMVGNLWERRHGMFALGTIFTLGTVCPLLAGGFEPQLATASAWRWFAAIFLLIGLTAFSFRKELSRVLALSPSERRITAVRGVLLFVTVFPLLLLTIPPVIDDINYLPPRGPQAGLFQAMGNVALYGVPLVFAAVALGIHAVRERSPAFAFATGLFVNLSVTVIHLVSIAAGNGSMNRVVLANSLQLNAIAAAGITLLWMGTRNWWMPPAGKPARTERFLLSLQKFIVIALNAVLMVPVALSLIALPFRVGSGTFTAGSFYGWLAVLLAIAVVIAFDKLFEKPISVASLSAALLAIGSLVAFGLARFGGPGWAGLHLLLGSVVLTAWLIMLARRLPRLTQNDDRKLIAQWWSRAKPSFAQDWEWDTTLFASFIGALAIVIALRSAFSDPTGAWWSIGAVLAMSALAATINWFTFNRAYLYSAGILLNSAVIVWLVRYDGAISGRQFLEANIVALSLSSVLWLWLELRARRLVPKLNRDTTWSFHNPAALLSLLLAGSIVAVNIGTATALSIAPHSFMLDWLALTSLTILLIACLWDRDAKYSVAALYLAGLMLAGNALNEPRLSPHRLAWAGVMILAAYSLLASLIWRARRQVIDLAKQIKIPPRIDPAAGELKWLIVFNSLVIAFAVALAFWIDLRLVEWSLRATGSLAIAAQVLTFALLAQGRWRPKLQIAAVSLLLMGAVFCGWSCLAPGVGGTWLNRAVILMAEMFVIVALFGAGLDKFIEREPDWTKAFRRCVPVMSIAGILALGFVLCTEVYYQIEFGAVRINPLALLTVAVTLAGGAAVCIVFALSPKHDPLGLTERRRSSYVYVAEAMLALLFMHIRLTMPWLFTGFFERYWPLIVLAIAYLGVTISELLRRRQVLVLARPIERTGALLPLLPVLGFWVAASQVDYSLLLFVVGGLYGLLSILRRSFLFGCLAALAGNGGLWHLLNQTSDYRFWQHPQLWLIPAALSVLIASYLNRKDFSESQMTGIRYLALVTIYVSSTTDIFINGVARSPWLPLVLAGLAVAGVLCGIMFRIRAFLLLGSIFLLLAVATMINYASVNFGWTWLWYVAGIVSGVLIIATFAMFEKKRAEVLRVVDGLKDWQR